MFALNDSGLNGFRGERVPSLRSGLRKSSAVTLARPVDLRLLKLFHQLRFVELLQVPDNALILRKEISLAIRQKSDQLVAFLGRKLIEKAGK
jgi:hypothetical protein